MLLRFFTVPVEGGNGAADELNQFLGSHRIVAIGRQFVRDGPNSAWALCVTHVQASSRPQLGRRGKIDYREVLSETNFCTAPGFSDTRQRYAALWVAIVAAIQFRRVSAGLR